MENIFFVACDDTSDGERLTDVWRRCKTRAIMLSNKKEQVLLKTFPKKDH
jgi:hypothetical protein